MLTATQAPSVLLCAKDDMCVPVLG